MTRSAGCLIAGLVLASSCEVKTAETADSAVSVSTFTYKRAGGLEIKADVHRLDDKEVRSVVVWIHGGALIMGGRNPIGRYGKRLVEEGLIVVSIDYRLAPETRLPFIIEDLEDAFKWVRTKGPDLFQADPDRIGVWGGSAGGYLALTSGFRVQPPPRVLVSMFGYGDLIGDWYSKPSQHARHQQIKMTESEARLQVHGPPIANAADRDGNGGAFYQFCRQRGIWPSEVSGWNPDDEPEKFHPYMAVKNVSGNYPPTFLIHGTDDTDVPYEQSVMMAEQLKKHGIEHRFVTIPNAEHGFGGGDPALVEEAIRAAIAFTKAHLSRD